MRPAFRGFDIIDETKDVFRVIFVVLNGEIDDRIFFGFRRGNRLYMERLFIRIEKTDKLRDPSLIMKSVFFVIMLINNRNFRPGV